LQANAEEGSFIALDLEDITLTDVRLAAAISNKSKGIFGDCNV